MEGDAEPCQSHFFRNRKGKCLIYGFRRDMSRFKEKFILEVTEKVDGLDVGTVNKVIENVAVITKMDAFISSDCKTPIH